MRKPIEDPGMLPHLLTIQTFAQTGTDAVGQPEGTWTPRGKAWSRIEPLEGRDFEVARQMHHLATHRITTRYNSQIDTDTRLVLGTRTFLVGAVQDLDERRVWLVLTCYEERP